MFLTEILLKIIAIAVAIVSLVIETIKELHK